MRLPKLKASPCPQFSLKLCLGKLGQIGGSPVLLAKPQTYMNLSGESVKPLASYYKIPPERVLAVIGGGCKVLKQSWVEECWALIRATSTHAFTQEYTVVQQCRHNISTPYLKTHQTQTQHSPYTGKA
ncbi:hypothetical protein R1flu_020811 [Riccia fluitans]|uniref:BRCT domain-containing protein n=1 Tax=Riccia fluitans TaxID=41844 RepID=A0ABD1ZMS2_9MARC